MLTFLLIFFSENKNKIPVKRAKNILKKAKMKKVKPKLRKAATFVFNISLPIFVVFVSTSQLNALQNYSIRSSFYFVFKMILDFINIV